MPPKSRQAKPGKGNGRVPKHIEQLTERLIQYHPRPEFLDVPGPRTLRDTRDDRKIPITFRTMPRFTNKVQPISDAIICNRAAIEPKPKVVVFSSDDRWPEKKTTTQNVKVYDVESGYRMVEKKTFSATFASERPPPVPKEEDRPLSPTSEIGEKIGTIAGSRISGGKISAGGRNTSEFFILRNESPGPIYNPNYAQVEGASASGIFSSQVRIPETKEVTTSSAATADAIEAEKNLSTYPKSPVCIIGNVPHSSSMPFPYNKHNFWNSLSMRTRFCQTKELRKASVAGGDTTITSTSSGERRKLRSVNSVKEVRGTTKWVEQKRAASADLQRSVDFGGISSPFARPGSAAGGNGTASSNSVQGLSSADAGALGSGSSITVNTVRFDAPQALTASPFPPDNIPATKPLGTPGAGATSFAEMSAVEEFEASMLQSDTPQPTSRPASRSKPHPVRVGGGFTPSAYKRPTSAAMSASEYEAMIRPVGDDMTLDDGTAGRRFQYAPKYPLKFGDEGYHSPDFMQRAVVQARNERPTSALWDSVAKSRASVENGGVM